MRFFVTSIAWTETSERLAPVTSRLTDALSALLGDGHFGGEVHGLSIFVIADKGEPDELAKQRAKVFSFSQIAPWPETVKRKELFVKVVYAWQELEGQSSEELLKTVSQGISKTMEARPNRLPKGFDYQRLAEAVRGVLSAFQK